MWMGLFASAGVKASRENGRTEKSEGQEGGRPRCRSAARPRLADRLGGAAQVYPRALARAGQPARRGGALQAIRHVAHAGARGAVATGRGRAGSDATQSQHNRLLHQLRWHAGLFRGADAHVPRHNEARGAAPKTEAHSDNPPPPDGLRQGCGGVRCARHDRIEPGFPHRHCRGGRQHLFPQHS
jgi:hypothetical protein